MPRSKLAPRANPDTLFDAACLAWRQGRRDEAIASLDEALRRRPDFAEALSMGGYMLGETGKPEAALRFYQRALSINPSLAVAQANLGKLFGVWRDVVDAMARELRGKVGPWASPRMIVSPCSIGELIDKITILRIKTRRIDDKSKLRNVRDELDLLEDLAIKEGLVGPAVEPLTDALTAVNAQLWDIEDEIRLYEREGDFGARFVSLARSVYAANDERAGLKRAVNRLFFSALIEEKSYA